MDKPVIPNTGTTALLRRLLFFEARFDMAKRSIGLSVIELQTLCRNVPDWSTRASYQCIKSKLVSDKQVRCARRRVRVKPLCSLWLQLTWSDWHHEPARATQTLRRNRSYGRRSRASVDFPNCAPALRPLHGGSRRISPSCEQVHRNNLIASCLMWIDPPSARAI